MHLGGRHRGHILPTAPLPHPTIFQVNGEVQKRSDEILAEAAITLTLSGLRGTPPGVHLGRSMLGWFALAWPASRTGKGHHGTIHAIVIVPWGII